MGSDSRQPLRCSLAQPCDFSPAVDFNLEQIVLWMLMAYCKDGLEACVPVHILRSPERQTALSVNPLSLGTSLQACFMTNTVDSQFTQIFS